MYELPTSITISGVKHPIRNKGDFRVILDCFNALQDVKLDKEYRTLSSLIIFYEELTSIESVFEVFPDETLFEAVEEMNRFFEVTKAKEKVFNPKNFVYMAGSEISKFGIISEGKIDVMNITPDGNLNLMFTLMSGELVCESVCFTKSKKIPFDIVAKTKTKIYFVDNAKLFSPELISEKFYPKLMENFFEILADGNITKAKKMDILSRRTTEDKVMTYLYMQSKLMNSKSFEIPFNREELATFLAVDRSALSTVLGKMKKNNKINFSKNKFTIL